LGILDALVAGGHQVRLAVGVDDGQVRVPCPVSLVPGLETRLRSPADLGAVAASFRPDVIHLHTVVNPAVLESAAGLKALITVQDHRSFCPTRGKWTAAGTVCRSALGPETCAACFEDEAYFREIFALTTARLEAIRRLTIVVLSRYMKRELESAGVDAARVVAIPPFVHGLDTDARPDGPPCVLFVGRLSTTKGIDDVLAAWRLSGLHQPLVFAGSGPDRGRLEAAGAEVLGWVDRPTLARLYRRAVALVMPSRWQEPFGIVGLEALTLGTPVVAWESGGVSEWHPGPGLVEWGDVAGLARALREAAGSRVGAPRGFEKDRLMEQLIRIYEEVAGLQPTAGSLR
jgi:glycosyltransferase involved in cell wall biosynthesis